MRLFSILTKNNGSDYALYFVLAHEMPTYQQAGEWLMENSYSNHYWDELDQWVEEPILIERVQIDGDIDAT